MIDTYLLNRFTVNPQTVQVEGDLTVINKTKHIVSVIFEPTTSMHRLTINFVPLRLVTCETWPGFTNASRLELEEDGGYTRLVTINKDGLAKTAFIQVSTTIDRDDLMFIGYKPKETTHEEVAALIDDQFKSLFKPETAFYNDHGVVIMAGDRTMYWAKPGSETFEKIIYRSEGWNPSNYTSEDRAVQLEVHYAYNGHTYYILNGESVTRRDLKQYKPVTAKLA